MYIRALHCTNAHMLVPVLSFFFLYMMHMMISSIIITATMTIIAPTAVPTKQTVPQPINILKLTIKLYQGRGRYSFRGI